MSIFLIVPTTATPDIIKGVLVENKMSFNALPRGEFFVSYRGTSQELSDLLGITDGKVGNAVVVAVSSYYGRASTGIWEWVQAHWDQA